MAAAGDDALLLARVADGDPAAFAQFYARWFDRVYSVARTVSRRDESFCLDVVQEVMWRAARRLPRLPDAAAAGAWLARTTCTVAIDGLRAERRRAGRERRHAGARPEAHVPPAAADLQAAELGQWLAAELAALPPRDRALLAGWAAADGSVAAAGTAFGMTADAAHGRFRRVLARLRAAAARWWGED